MSSVFRHFPTVADLLESAPIKKLMETATENSVVSNVQTFLDQLRSEVQSAAESAPSVSELADRFAQWAGRRPSTTNGPLVNATGVLLSDELGRAPLAEELFAAASAAQAGFSQHSNASQAPALAQLTEAESAMATNGPADAMLLTLAAAASGGQVVVGRSDLTTFGRCSVPQLIPQAGAELVEVGAVNSVTMDDYQQATQPNTRALLKIIPSDFAMAGASQAVSVEELSVIARRRSLPLIVGYEAGAVVDLQAYGVSAPTVKQLLDAGADAVVFAGDLLLGGPPCGLIVGKRQLLNSVRQAPQQPLVNANKVTLALLNATVDIYAEQDRESRLPLLQLISTSLANLVHRAERLAPQLKSLASVADVSTRERPAHVFFNVPNLQMPSSQLVIHPQSLTASEFADRLRAGSPSVWATVENNQLVIDMRTLRIDDDERVLEAFRGI